MLPERPRHKKYVFQRQTLHLVSVRMGPRVSGRVQVPPIVPTSNADNSIEFGCVAKTSRCNSHFLGKFVGINTPMGFRGNTSLL